LDHIAYLSGGVAYQQEVTMKPIPQVQKYMSTTPINVDKNTNLLVAAKMMKEHDIRHLPVTYDGKLEGILSSTDINLIRTIHGAEIDKLLVRDCFTANPDTVQANALIDSVMTHMAANKFGCMPVLDNGKLVGIFTWVDALKAASDLLHTRLK
jgi:acetoin utilization protein AcuB